MTQHATWPARWLGKALAAFVERVDHRATLTRKAVSALPGAFTATFATLTGGKRRGVGEGISGW